MGVLDGIKAISAQLGLGSGLSLAKFMDPEIVEMLRFLDPEIVEKVDKSYITYFPISLILQFVSQFSFDLCLSESLLYSVVVCSVSEGHTYFPIILRKSNFFHQFKLCFG